MSYFLVTDGGMVKAVPSPAISSNSAQTITITTANSAKEEQPIASSLQNAAILYTLAWEKQFLILYKHLSSLETNTLLLSVLPTSMTTMCRSCLVNVVNQPLIVWGKVNVGE